ncbi:hypothetical protein [Tateyamaria sp.]|uniref:hypothetical protein n=1 Tax=Tateyamaria sp. TaxID=1929288 RepID=UPI003B21074F
MIKGGRIAAAMLLMAACTAKDPAPPEAVCAALRPALPTWARADTDRSKREGARFLDVWAAVCGDAD